MNKGVVQEKKRTMDERLGLFREIKNYRLKNLNRLFEQNWKKRVLFSEGTNSPKDFENL